LIGAVGGAMLLRSRDQLFGIATLDLATFVAVPLLLIVVALLASYGPARRASRVDPAVTLRSD
jgi:ABC-type lipoprotein release transport system permease subunit